MTRSGVRSLQHQDRQHQGMIKCMNEYAGPLKKNEYTKLMSQLRSTATTISTPNPTTTTTAPIPPAFSIPTFFSSKPPRTTNPSKFAGIGGPPPNRLVFHALPSSSSKSSSSSSKEEKMSKTAVDKKKMMKKKIGSDTVTTTMNHRFVTWRVEDHNRGKGLNYSGVSASELAGRLSGDFWDDHIDDDEDDDYEEEEEEDIDLDQDQDLGLEDTEVFPYLPVQSVKVSQVEVIDSKIKEDGVDSSDERIEIEDEGGNQDEDESEEEEDDDHMSFCEVEFMIDQLDDDEDEVGWCLVDDY